MAFFAVKSFGMGGIGFACVCVCVCFVNKQRARHRTEWFGMVFFLISTLDTHCSPGLLVLILI